MFIETYYDERHMVPASSREPAIPYPELAGEELSIWQRYLPVTTELRKVPFWLHDHTPQLVIEHVEKAQKQHLFDRIEVWSRAGDPMVVGVMNGKPTRYFSIARWGDAELTLEQIKTRLRVENWISNLIPVAMIFIFLLVVTLAVI
jgi:hypothetical protein